MGRPKGTERGRRTQLALYVTGEEREAFGRRSSAVGMTVGEWARTVLRRDAGLWVGGKIMTTKWDFESYWNTVLGANRSECDVVREFDLTSSEKRDLSEWLWTAEAEAWRVGGQGGREPEEWAAHHERAVEILRNAVVEVNHTR